MTTNFNTSDIYLGVPKYSLKQNIIISQIMVELSHTFTLTGNY